MNVIKTDKIHVLSTPLTDAPVETTKKTTQPAGSCSHDGKQDGSCIERSSAGIELFNDKIMSR